MTNILVNDAVVGDPFFTVPLLVSEEILQRFNVPKLSLCYEIHGEGEQWFNMITDKCTSVNARYSALAPSFNIIDKIGIRTVDDNGQCVNILVDIDGCSASVNNVSLGLLEMYSSGGLKVKRYSNRVRISTPNCNELTLVLWMICEKRAFIENPDYPTSSVDSDMIKLVVMRGLNAGHSSAHGLIGKHCY